MRGDQGKQTGEFGEWLTKYIEELAGDSKYIVYYDHGDTQSANNVAETKGFFGDSVSNENRLAGVDVMVAKHSGQIVMLIEIEERQISPKKLLGDVLAILMCNRFAVRVEGEQKYFEIIPETQLVVAGVVPTKGYRLEKINEVIGPRLKRFRAPRDSINPEKVKFVFCGDIKDTINILKQIVQDTCDGGCSGQGIGTLIPCS